MELLLALAVITAVIIFGALISIGNERQRRAIDELREQVVLWAIQDLRIKRDKLAREVQVDDPIGWLNQMVARVNGENMALTVSEFFEDPQVLVCIAGDSRKVALSPASPKDIRRFQQAAKSKLSRVGNVHPLMNLPRNADALELSMLNGGMLFDLELKIAWRGLTGRQISQESSLFLYIF
ncbi:MAG: hypothetical protein M5U11_00785 [Anaerolineales bacterium]|nr:hypothetical protein [Anaerolineales bacterium]